MTIAALIRRPVDLALVRAGAACGETVALCAAADDEARPLLAHARAAGAARLVQLWDPELAATDYAGIAQILSVALLSIGKGSPPALVLAGDRGRGAVGPAVSERLSLPLIGRAADARLDGDKVIARRHGRRVLRVFATAAPALVCLTLAEATAPAAAPAEDVDIESWQLGDVGLSASELHYRKRLVPAPAERPPARARPFTDASALVERLRAEGLLVERKGAR